MSKKRSNSSGDEGAAHKKQKLEVSIYSHGSTADKSAINATFNTFATSLSTLLSLSDGQIGWALTEDKANFMRALTSLKSEMTWLPEPAPLHPPTLSPVRPAKAGSYPPSIPPLSDPKLQKQAFTHRSYIPGELANHSINSHYERLEFLGDAFIQSLSSELLYSRFPDEREGALSQMRQTLVSNATLAEYACLYQFDKQLRVGKNVSDLVKPETKMKTLADMFEAYVGAIIVEKGDEEGVKVVKNWLSALWEPRVKDWESKRGMLEKVDKNAKQELQVVVGGNLAKLNYKWCEGAGGNKGGYWVEVKMTGWGKVDQVLGKGWGQNKSDAQLRAAMNVLANKSFCEEMAQKKAETLTRGKPPASNSATPEVNANAGKPRAEMTEEEKKAENKRHREEKKLKKKKMKEESERRQDNVLPNPEKSGAKQEEVVLDY